MKKGEVDFLTPTEIQFWKDLLEKYLYPIDDNKEEKVRESVFCFDVNVLLNFAALM